jgi:hypothetical protein
MFLSGKFILVFEVYLQNKYPIDFGRQRLEIELSYIFDFEDGVGGEVVALDAHVVDLAIGHVDVLLEFFVFRGVHRLCGLGSPLLMKRLVFSPVFVKPRRSLRRLTPLHLLHGSMRE